MTTNSSNKTENELIEICQQIGAIAQTNRHYTSVLARTLKTADKPLLDMTLGELLALDAECTHYFNNRGA